MKKLFLILSIISFTTAFAQNIPLDQQVQKRYNEITLAADTSIFTGFRAIDWLEVKHILDKHRTQLTDSAFGLSAGDAKGYFFKQLATNNWIQANGNNSVFAIDPYFDAAIGKSKEQDNVLYQAAAGLRLQGVANDKFSYSLGYIYYNQRFPNYLNTYTQGNQGYVAGMGKGSLLQNGGYSFSQVTGHFTYIPNKHFLVSVGNGKNFIGDGYRSLILSDNSANYPYLRLQAKYWRFTYNVVYAVLDDPRYQADSSSRHKYSAMHYLGINFSKKFQLGIYDNVIWLARDKTVHRGFDVQYLNPLIFMRPTEFAVGSPDNAFLGLTAKYKLSGNAFLYGQIALDDLHLTESIKNKKQHFGDKYGIQLGLWNKDLFGAKGLSWRLEFNSVRPYTYTHGFDKPALNYTHANQALADPFGANFNEFISVLQYNHGRWYGELENLYTIRGEGLVPRTKPGTSTIVYLPSGYDLWGGDLTNNNYSRDFYYGSTTTQGVKNNYFYNQLTVGYLINPRNRLAIQGDVIARRHTVGGDKNTDFYFSIGIKTGLYNFYKDF
jgi:hypothetical protein